MLVSFITITLLSTVQNIAAQPRHLTVIYGVNREVIINRLCWHPSYHNIYYNDTKRNIIYCRFATFGNIAIWIAIIINICCVYTMMMIRRRRKRNRRRKRRSDGWWNHIFTIRRERLKLITRRHRTYGVQLWEFFKYWLVTLFMNNDYKSIRKIFPSRR